MQGAALEASAIQQRTSENLQDLVAAVTGMLLVPTLVAGIFGANTAVPGEHTWWNLALMVVLMLASSVAALFAYRRIQQRKRISRH